MLFVTHFVFQQNPKVLQYKNTEKTKTKNSAKKIKKLKSKSSAKKISFNATFKSIRRLAMFLRWKKIGLTQMFDVIPQRSDASPF